MTSPPLPAEPLQDRPLVIEVGGSSDFWGGLQIFCERSAEALQRYGGWRVVRLQADSAHMSLTRLPKLSRGLSRLIAARKQKPQCIWIQYGNMADLSYVLLARALGLRVVVTPHLGRLWRSRSNPLLRLLSNVALQGAHRLALISPTQDEELRLPRSIPRSAIRTFLPALVLEGVEPTIEPDTTPLRLLHASRLSAEKGTFLFVDMCAALQDLGVAFEARIAGNGDDAVAAELGRAIESAGLSDRIACVGMLSGEDMADTLRWADILGHLSRQDSYPLVVLEALGCGVMPICFNLAGARQIVDLYDGLIVDDDDLAGSAARWLASLEPGVLRARGKAQAAKVRRDFSWSDCAADLAAALTAAGRGNSR